jgi:hypothetical protein
LLIQHGCVLYLFTKTRRFSAGSGLIRTILVESECPLYLELVLYLKSDSVVHTACTVQHQQQFELIFVTIIRKRKSGVNPNLRIFAFKKCPPMLIYGTKLGLCFKSLIFFIMHKIEFAIASLFSFYNVQTGEISLFT